MTHVQAGAVQLGRINAWEEPSYTNAVNGGSLLRQRRWLTLARKLLKNPPSDLARAGAQIQRHYVEECPRSRSIPEYLSIGIEALPNTTLY